MATPNDFASIVSGIYQNMVDNGYTGTEADLAVALSALSDENGATTKWIDLGASSAYAIAVEHGYTGTEEEWIALLMNTTQNAQIAQESAESAAESAASARQSEEAIPTKKEEALQAIASAESDALQSVNTAGTTQIGLVEQEGSDQKDVVTAEGEKQTQRVFNQGILEVQAVANEGTRQMGLVTDEGDAQVARVTAEGTTQVGLVTAEGTTQVGNVSDEGASQIAAVQEKGDEVIDSIPQDYSALTQNVSALNSTVNYDQKMLYSVGSVPSEWEQGSLYSSSGGEQANVKRLRTVSAFFLTDEVIINVNDGYRMQLYGYSGTDSTYYGVWNGSTFEKASHFSSEPIQTAQLPKTYKYKIVLAYSDETSVTEMPVSEAFNCVTYSEKYLPKSSYEADKISYAYDTSKSLTDGMLPHFAFKLGNIGESGQKISSTTVCRTTTIKFDKDTFIRCVSSEYNYGLRRYSGEEISASNFVDYLGLFEGTYRLKADAYYVITLAKRTPETITDVDEYAKQIEVWSQAYLEEMRKYELDRFAPFGNTRRKIYAHKGITQNEPENTVPSFEAAGAGGAWGIETDIQATSDGYLICMHDTTVDRTTDGTGSIASMTMAEIDQLRIKNHPDLKVPTVEQYLGICKTYGCVPCMELKNVASSQEMITKLLQTITDYGLESTAVILCSQYSIGYIQCINPKIRCVFIIDPTNLEEWIPRVQRYFNVSVTMASGTYTVTPEIIKQLHAAGLVVNVGGVNTVDDIKTYFAMGADSVSSDFIATY